MLFTNHSWEWGWQNSGWGFCQNKSDNNWQLIPLPLPLLYLSPPSSCLIMLLCVCLSVCILCVKECVFLRSLCQCVCSSNTGFSPPLPSPPSSLLTFWWLYTHLFSISNQTLFVYFPIIFAFLHSTTLHLSRSSPTPHHFIHLSIHWSIHSPSSFGFLLPTSLINPLPLFLYFSSLVSCSPLSLPPSPCPLRSPPFLPSSLSFTQCSVPRSLWLGCSSVAESLCALRCLQSIPSTRAHNQVLPLSS